MFQNLQLEGEQFDELTNLMYDETYNSEDVIFKAGKMTEAALYFVYEGNVQLSGRRTELIKPGMFFGEEHFAKSNIPFDNNNHAPSSSIETVATYTASVTGPHCVCAVLTLSDSWFAFPDDSQPEPQVLSNGGMSCLCEEEEDEDMLEAAPPPLSLTLNTTTTANWLQEHSKGNVRQLVRSQLNLDDLDRIAMLGEGQFGEVWLVRPMLNSLYGHQFALKIQSKKDDTRGGEAKEMIGREIHVLSQMDHPVSEFACQMLFTSIFSNHGAICHSNGPSTLLRIVHCQFSSPIRGSRKVLHIDGDCSWR